MSLPRLLLLDTSILLHLVRDNWIGRSIESRFRLRTRAESSLVSVITVGEVLAFGEKRNWGSTVLGWFVIQGGAEAAEGDAATPASPDDPAAPALAGPDPAATFVEPPPPSRGGQVDFDAVFAAAGIDDEERARVGKAAELLDTLPTATEPAVKQQIVEASLKAFGVPIEKIIEAGVQEIQALQAYIQTGAQDTQKVLEESQRRIAQYEEN